MNEETFEAKFVGIDPETPCLCDSCGWQGRFCDALGIGATELRPGDVIPAGRCPNQEVQNTPCGNLVFLNRDVDQILARFINGQYVPRETEEIKLDKDDDGNLVYIRGGVTIRVPITGSAEMLTPEGRAALLVADDLWRQQEAIKSEETRS
jgi:hypothetical protein